MRIGAMALALGLAFHLPARAEARTIIAVFDMTAEGLRRVKPVQLKRLTDYLANQLTAKGAFRVVPRDRLIQQLRNQKKTSFKKCFDQSCQIEIGRELAANKSLATKVMRFGKKCIVTATLYDLKTATTEGGANAKGKCNMDGLLKATEEIAAKLSGGGGSSGYSAGGSSGSDPGYSSGAPAGAMRVAWPPQCPPNKPKACLERARTLKEQDQALVAALFAYVQAERKGRWRIRKLAQGFMKQLLQGYVPRQTQLEQMLKGACRRRAGACYATAMLKRAEGLHPEALKHLRRACDKGELAACTAMGKAHNDGRGTAKDSAKARSLFKRACDRNYLPACVQLAGLHRYGSGGLTKNATRAIALYRRACDRRYMQACSKLGSLYSWGKSKNFRKALALYRRACDGGLPSACNSLAYMHKAGRGVPKNATKARAIYRKACSDGYVYACTSINDYARAAKLRREKCDRGDLYACNSLASMYKRGKGVPTNSTKANALYRRSCDLGNISACISLKDNRRIVELYQRGCDGGNKYNCNALATRYKNGQGVVANPQKAVQYYRKACDGKYASACNSLASMYRNAQGVARNETKAVALYRHSCAQGNMVGCEGAKEYGKMVAYYRQRCNTGSMYNCNLLAVKYNMGQGVSKSQSKAATLFRKACNGNYMKACANLAYLYNAGQGVARSSVTARSLYKRACDGGYKTACSYGSSSSSSSKSSSKKRYQQYRHSCNNGNMADCNRLGASYSFGSNGAIKSKILASTYYRKACLGGNMTGCSNLAHLYKNGQGVSRSDYLSQKYFRKACDGGYRSACSSVRGGKSGTSYSASSSSSGGKRYLQYSRDCTRGNMDACNSLAASYGLGSNGAFKSQTLAVKYYRKACTGGFMMACSNLAYRFKNGQGVSRSATLARVYYRKACNGGYKSACSQVGGGSSSSYRGGKRYMQHKDACKRGSAFDCDKVGYSYRFGANGALKLPTLAVKYYRKACDMRYGASCAALATLYSLGKGVSRSSSQSAFYKRLACSRGHSSSCSGGRSTSVSRISGSSGGKIYRQWLTACNNRRDAAMCDKVGLAYSFGNNGAPKLPTLAAKYYRKACDMGRGMGCANLASLYRSGKGVSRSSSQAAFYKRLACKRGHRGSCSGSSGSSYSSSSSGGKPYLDHSRRCRSGSMRDCNLLGAAYSFGSKGAMKSKLLARVYYLKACNGGHAIGCANAAFLYKKGQGGKRDFYKARQLYQKACRLGNRSSCNQR